MRGYGCAVAAVLILASAASIVLAAPPPHRHRHPTRHKIVRKAEWSGAGAAAGHLAGPVGSAAVGAVKYRHDLKKNWHTRRRAMVRVGAPIAASAVAGPVGTVGYEADDHRRWLKRHLTPGKHHRRPVQKKRGASGARRRDGRRWSTVTE